MGFRHSLRESWVCNITEKSGGLQPFWTWRQQLGGFSCELELQGEEMWEGMRWERSCLCGTSSLHCWALLDNQAAPEAHHRICGLCWFLNSHFWLSNSHFCHKLQGSPQADCLSLAGKLNSLHSAASWNMMYVLTQLKKKKKILTQQYNISNRNCGHWDNYIEILSHVFLS